MRFGSTALIMMALALMLLALMLLTPTVRANPMTFVANLAGHESLLQQFANDRNRERDCIMISDAELIALWHTKESRTTIAARLQIPGAILQQECSSMAVVPMLARWHSIRCCSNACAEACR